MPPKYIYFFLALFFVSACAQDDVAIHKWEKIKTAEELWHTYPGQIHALFEALDLQQPSLAPIRSLLVDGDTLGGAERLLDYFAGLDRSWVISALDSTSYPEPLGLASALLSDSVIIGRVAAGIPLEADGGWQWSYTGPEKDDEFGYSLNGHKYLPALLVAWEKTVNTDYVKVFDRVIKDWVIHHPLPAEGDSIYMVLDPSLSIDWRDIGEVEWRTLEAGRRLGSTWPQLFYAFQQEEAFSPAARLLFLSSIAEQAAYLRQYHKSGHNWTTMEMNGLALTALAFPEFKAAEDWANYALEVMSGEINRQVYPDGVQTEISTKTQWVALRRFESLAENFQKADRSISEAYLRRLEDMYNYLAYCMRPDGAQPLNNDSDREDLRPRVLKAAEKFNRGDWQWIATNGKKGTMPETKTTIIFPWAGVHIMRNAWDEQAHWAFFDIGPYGTGHQHRDKLHLSITAFGKDLLVDGGRYTHQDYFSFDPAVWRGYFRSSFSHNVVLVDGKGQNAGPTRASAALVEGRDYLRHSEYDYAYGVFNDGYQGLEGKAVHTRSVLYLRDQYWLALDHFETDRLRNLQALWHYAPDCQVVLEGREAVSTNANESNLRIVPLGNIEWHAEIVAGQEKPFIQGWYSADYGVKVPNSTVVYSAKIDRSSAFAWLLIPAEGEVPEMDAQFQQEEEKMLFSIAEKGRAPIKITLPLKGDLSKVDIKF